MIRSQGKFFSDEELDHIVELLRESEMSLPDIARRMNCSRSAIAGINRKFQVRLYQGNRHRWNVGLERRAVDVRL